MNGRFLLLVSSQVVGQLSVIAALPLLTRVFATAEIGAYQLAFALAMVLQPIATLRLEYMLPTIGATEEVRRLVRLATTILGSCTGLLLGGAVVMSAVSGGDSVDVVTTLVMAALILLGYGVTVLNNAILARNGQTTRLAVRNLVAGLLTAVLQLACALFFPSIMLVAVSVLVARVVAVFATGRRVAHIEDIAQNAPQRWTLRRSLTAITSGFISTLPGQALTFLASGTAGIAWAGQVGVAQRTASAPIALISQGVSQHTQSELSGTIRRASAPLRPAVIKQLKLVTPFAVLAMVGLAVLGPPLAGPVFGPGWEPAGTIIATLAVPSGLQLLVAPLMPLMVMLGQETRLLLVQIVRVIAALGGGGITLALSGDFLTAVIGYAAGSAIGYVVLLAVVLRTVRRHDIQSSEE